MFDIFKKYTFNDLKTTQLDDLKKKVKILVIDDDPNSFPVEKIQNFGFTVEAWEYVNAERLKRLENNAFDIIILDIEGVVKPELGNFDGTHILTLLKEKTVSKLFMLFLAINTI